MNRCKNCGVVVLDETQVCPLCQTVLSDDTAWEEEYIMAGYPDNTHKVRMVSRVCRIGLYLAVVIEVLLILINYYTFAAVPTRWSFISGGALLYLVMTMWDIIKRRTGHIRKLYVQMFAVMGLLVIIDIALGWTGWSLEYGLPCEIFGITLVIVICMCINYANWQNYVIMQMIVILFSIVDMVLLLTGVVHHTILTIVAIGVTTLLWTGTLIIGDRKATNELKRKLHI